MDYFSSYTFLIGSSAIIILSFFFSEISRKTNIPSVLMLIVLGVVMQQFLNIEEKTILPILKILGIVGLIMIVLEAALELELKKEKYIPILKAMVIALIGLILSAWVAAEFLNYFIDGMTMQKAWLYATPLSILSSAIIIPSVSGLNENKKEFHIYESTFSDILGIMMFLFLKDQYGETASAGGVAGFGGNVLLTLSFAREGNPGLSDGLAKEIWELENRWNERHSKNALTMHLDNLETSLLIFGMM